MSKTWKSSIWKCWHPSQLNSCLGIYPISAEVCQQKQSNHTSPWYWQTKAGIVTKEERNKGKRVTPTPCIIRLNKRDLKSYYLISTLSVDTFAGQYFLSFMLLTSILTFTSQWFFIHLLMTLHLFCFGFFFDKWSVQTD